MSASILLDTNVLVYAYDIDEPERRARAIELLKHVRRAPGSAAVSTQVLGEYCSVMTHKFAHVWDAESVAGQVRRFARAFHVATTDTDVILEAIRGAARYQLSYYDAQIWAVARVNDIPVVLSEDFTDGQELEGVRFINPFAEEFDLSSL